MKYDNLLGTLYFMATGTPLFVVDAPGRFSRDREWCVIVSTTKDDYIKKLAKNNRSFVTVLTSTGLCVVETRYLWI